MPKNYWFKALFFVGAMLLLGKIDAQVKFQIELQSDSVTYQVSLYSEIGPYPATAQNFINSSTITLIAPTGELAPAGIVNQKGIWSGPDTYVNPVTSFGMDYFVFNLTGSINDILFTPGLIVPLFTFTNSGNCAGAVSFMDNDNDPYLNQSPDVNIGNQMSVLGNGLSNAFNGEHEPGNANCMGALPCDLTLDSISFTGITSCGAMDGMITIHAANNTGTIQYSLDNGLNWLTSNVFPNLIPGDYTVKIKDDICEQVYPNNPVSIIEPSITVTLLEATAPTCNNSFDGIIRIAATGGTAPYEYTINNGASWSTDSVFNTLGNGFYNIEARNTDGNCLSDFPNNPVVFAVQGIDVTAAKIDGSCTNGTGGSINITAAGGIGNFEYSIDSGVTWLANNNFSDLSPGSYPVFVRNGNGECAIAFQDNPLIIQESVISFTVDATNPDCNNAMDGLIAIVADGSAGNFEYSIDSGLTWLASGTFNALDTGTYFAAVRAIGGGCETFFNSPTQLVSTGINISLTTLSGDCAHNSNNRITIAASGGSGNFEYSIDNGTNWLSNNVFNGLATGAYEVKVRNTSGSCETDYVNNPVTFSGDSIAISVDVTPPSCDLATAGSISINATGSNNNYIYSIDNGASFSNESTFTGLANGNYTIRVRNGNGACESVYQNNPVQLNAAPVVLSVSFTENTCENVTDGTISMIGNGGTGNFEYSIDSGSTWSTSATRTNLAADLYYLQVRNSDGTCTTDFVNNPVDLTPNAINFSIVSNTPPSCETNDDGSLILAATGGTSTNYEFSIDNGNTFSSVGTFQNLSTGAYNLQVRNIGADCITSHPDNPIMVVNSACPNPSVNVDCILEYVLSEDNGEFTISLLSDTTWNSPFNTVSSAQISIRLPANNYQIDNLQNAISGVTFEESSRISSTIAGETYDFISFTLTTFATTDIPFIKDNQVDLFSFQINGACSADAIHLVGEGSPFSFPDDATNNIASQMTVVGWGSADVPICVDSLAETLCVFAVQNVSITDASFCGAADGALSISTSCAGNSALYSIDNGRTYQNASTFTGLSAGNYFVRILNDSTNCEIIYDANPVIINDGNAISFTATSVQPTCVDSTDGAISFTAINGSGSYLYSIDDGRMWSTNPTYTNLPVGDFYLKVSNLDTTCIVVYDTLFLALSAGPCVVDTDMDGQPDANEDLNMNGDLTDDDTDMDGIPNFQDADDDGDGVSTIMEEAGPNQGDSNGDNLSDCLQANVATTTDANGDYRTLEVNGLTCAKISEFIVHPEGQMSESDLEYDFPFDLNAFRIPCAGTVDIQLYFHNSIDLTGFIYRKYGPMEPDGPISEWYNFPVTISTAVIGGQTLGTVSFQLTDGDMGDATGVDSLIVDPGGLAMNVANVLPCPMNYAVEKIGDTYTVSLTSDTTFTPPANVINDALITLRAPTGVLDTANLVNIISTVIFELDSAYIAPIETPNFDYFVFKLSSASTGTTDIPLVKNFKQDLFSFENFGTCSTDSLFLVGTGANFSTPPIGGQFINSAINVNGWTAPTCVSNLGASFCLPPARDTVPVELLAGTSIDTCLITEIDLPNGVGNTTVLIQGTNVNGTTTNRDSCVQITAASGIEVVEYVTVVFCDVVNANICDTTVLEVTVTEIPFVPTDTVNFTLNFNDTTEVCLGSAIQITDIGMASVINAGSQVDVSVNNTEDCVTLMPANGFSGNDTLQVLHCDAKDPTLCDTTFIVVTVNEPLPCLFKYIIEENDDNYLIRLAVDSTVNSPLNATTSMLVAIRVPASGFDVPSDSITTLLSGVAFENTSDGVLIDDVNPAYGYINFDIGGLTFPNYQAGDTLDLFSFSGAGCTGDSIHLVGPGANFSNPTVNGEEISSYLSIGQFLPIGGTPYCVNPSSVLICEPVVTPPMTEACAINFDMELVNGTFTISMTPDTTIFNTSSPNPFIGPPTSVMDITLRAPTGTLQPVNQIDFGTGREFVLKNSIISPTESPAYDYFVFGLNDNNVPTVEVRYNEGQTIELFSFQNINCTLDSIFLVGRGTNFSVPTIAGLNVETSVVTNGDIIPTCVNGTAIIPAEMSFSQTSVNPTTGNCMDGSITITASGGTGLYNYSIDNGVTWQTFNTFSNLEVGNYLVRIRSTDENCITAATSVSLTNLDCDNSPPPCSVTIASVSNTDATCSQANGVITINATGPNLQYSINTGATFQSSNVFQNVSAGIYNIVVRDSVVTTCEANTTHTLNGTDGPVISAVNTSDSTTFAANEGIITILATGPAGLKYSLDAGLNYSTTNTFSNLGIGTYNIMVVNMDDSCPVTFDNNPLIIAEPCLVDAGADVTICEGEMITLSATGSATNYSWTPATGLSATNISNPIATPTVTTTYYVTNSDASCTAQDSVTITVAPNITVDFQPMVSCTDLSVDFTDNSTSTESITSWLWDFGDGVGTSSEQNPSYTYFASGTYVVSLTTTNSTDCDNTITKSIVVGNGLNVTVSEDATICVSDCLTLTASGGTTYQWNASSDLSATDIPNPIACPTETTTYYVTVMDGNGCSEMDSVTITIDSLDIGVSANGTSCDEENGSITIFATLTGASFEFQIEEDGPWSTSNTFTNLAAGSYNVSVRTLGGGCETPFVNNPVQINSVSAPTIDLVLAEEPSDCNLSDGSITISASGNNPLIYSINGGTDWSDLAIFNDLEEGNYVVQVAYADTTCLSVTEMVEISAPAAPVILLVEGTNPVTCESEDGVIHIEVEDSGAGTFEYSLNGIDWQDTNLFEDLPAGNFSVFVRFQGGSCIVEHPSTIELIPGLAPQIFDVVQSDPTAVDLFDGSISINASGIVDLEYSIDNGTTWQADNVFSGLDTGAYDIKVRYIDESCETPFTARPVVLGIGDCLSFIEVSYHGPFGCGSDDGHIFILVNDPANVEYSINNGATWQNFEFFENLAPGNYTILARKTDRVCEIALDSTITLMDEEDLMIFDVQTMNPDACNGTNGEIFINTNIFSNIEFSIDNGTTWQVDNIFSNVAVGTYTILARSIDLTCQTSYDEAIVIEETETTINDVLFTNPTSCNAADGSILIDVTGSFNLEYSINNGATWQFGNQFFNLASGTYTIKVRTGNCELEYTGNPVILGSPTEFSVVTAIPNAATCTDVLSGVSVTLSDNIASYIVNNGNIVNATQIGATLTFDAVVADIFNEYSLTFTNAQGCEVTESFVVFQATDTEADFVVIEPYCKEMEVSLLFTGTATPMANLIWEIDGGVLVNSAPATATAPAGHEITVRWDSEGSRLIKLTVDDGGCMDDEFESIFVRKLPLADAGLGGSICMGECVQLQGSGTGVWYTWSPAAGLSTTDGLTTTACPTETTTYYLTVMSADGCVALDSVTVNVETDFLTVTPDMTICEGQSAILGANGGSNYVWTPTASLVNPNSSTPIANPQTTTTYTVVSPNASGCMDTAQVTVFVNPNPEAIACEDKTICNGDSIQLIVTTHAQYAWSPTNTLINPNSGTPIAFPTVTTTYTVTVTDENGCTDTDEVVVFVNTPPTVSAGNDVQICTGASTQLSASGAISYSWSPATGLNNPNLSNPIATPSTTTTYTVTGTDANGCSRTDQVTVSVTNDSGITASSDLTICEGESTTLSVTGGANYTWSPATGLSNPLSANPTANPTVTTVYTVTGTSINGCPTFDNVTVFVNPKPEAIACEDKFICLGDSIQLIVTTHAQYAWSPSNTLINPNSGTPIAFPTQTTTYTVTVTDENGCTDTDEVVVNVNNSSTVVLGPDRTICGAGPVQLDAGNGIAYQWSPTTGLSDPTIRNPIATVTNTINYSVQVMTANGCTGQDDITINVNAAPTANAGPNLVLCPGESGQLMASGGVSYQWSPTTGLSNPNIANPIVTTDGVTNYTVTVMDEFGCTATDETLVAVSLPLTIDPVLSNATCCGNGGSAILNVSGGFGNATFNWTPNVSNSNTATNLAVGFYKVVIEDAESCSVVFTFEIEEDCDGCPDMFGEEERCITSTDVERICLPIAMEDINRYNILVDGANYMPDHGCEFEDLTAYSYALVEGQGNTGMYRIENWEVNGQMHATEVETMQDLTFWMNTIDPTGNWILTPSALSIIGGDPTKTYSTMKVIQMATWVETVLLPSTTGIATSTILEVDVTTLVRPMEIIITDTATCCSDTILLRRCGEEQPCVEEIIAQNTFSETVTCGETATLCLEIPFNRINNFDLEANGSPFNGDIIPCDYDSMLAYTYFTLPNQGAVGPYRINSWIVDGQMHSGMFDNVGELVSIMNQIDPTGNWLLDPTTLTLQGGNNATNYGEMIVEQTNTGALATLDINTNLIPMGTQVSLESGSYEFLIISKNSGCQDRIVVNIACEDDTTPPVDTTVTPVDTTVTPVDTTITPVDTMTMTNNCADYISSDFLFATVNRCDSLAAFCLPIAFETINEYTVTLDGAPYQGVFGNCSDGTSIEVGVGGYVFHFEHQTTGCLDSIAVAVNCVTNAREEVVSIVEGDSIEFCPESDELIGAIISIENLCEDASGIYASVDLDMTNFCVSVEGILTGQEQACFVICDDMGVCDTTYLIIKVTPKSLENPVALRDVDTTQQAEPITIAVLDNDSINGKLQNMEILERPSNGQAIFNDDNTITYTPNNEFCNSGSPDLIMYGICNDNGCDTAIVEVWVPCPTMEILSGFSPNDDGINDFFTIKGIQNFPNNELQIFNRWGSKVFQQKGYKNKWDGSYENQNLPDGTYFYLLKDGSGTKYSGFVQINR